MHQSSVSKEVTKYVYIESYKKLFVLSYSVVVNYKILIIK